MTGTVLVKSQLWSFHPDSYIQNMLLGKQWCDCEERLEHYFFHCNFVKQFWTLLSHWRKWVSDNYSFRFGALDIVFGMTNETNDDLISALDYCIIVAKKYINSCRLESNDCDFDRFLHKLKQRLIVEEYIATINDRLEIHTLKWSFVRDSVTSYVQC